ncbi:MAG: acetate--CoA ligase family protein [Bacillota bacterium]
MRDKQMGPVVMFGLGGTLVELHKDVVFRMAPISVDEARKMIESVKGAALFKGYRGGPHCDTDSLAESVTKVSGKSVPDRLQSAGCSGNHIMRQKNNEEPGEHPGLSGCLF